MAYKARKSGVKSGERVSPFARQQNLFAFDDGATVSDYTNATIMMLADIVNGAKVTELKKTISIYNDRARDAASGQSDIFSAELKTKEDILKEVNELLNYGTEEAKELALSRADASRRASSESVGAESVEQDGTAGVSREGSADVEYQPVGKGVFGNIYDQFKGKAKEAIAFLLQKKEGEATGALHHKDIGDIDLVWGEEGTGKSDGFGLAKLVKYHPEVLDNLQNILDDMHVVQRSDNRVRLESVSHQAAVRLTWDNQKKNWLLTAFEKKNSAPDNTTDTAETLKEGERNDTATPQNTVSIGKDTDKSSSVQENGGKNAETRETALRDGLIDKLRSAGIEVITDEEEAQRVLDADRERRARLMGSRVEKRKQEIAAKLEGKEMSDEQRTVVNVFTGRKNNLTLNITDKSGKSRSIVMRQGNEQNAGTKHSIYRHYMTDNGHITADDILLVPDVVANGERKPVMRGKTQLYEYMLKDGNGTLYTVLTEKDKGREVFADFYTNRKTSLSARKTRSEEARDIDNSDVTGAKLQKVSDFANYSPVFYSNAEKAVEGISQNKATAEQWLAMIQKQGGLKAGEDKWLGLRDWLTARKGQSLTKEELLDYIRENQVHVDEVSYTANPQGFEDLKREYDGWLRNDGYDYAWEQLRERFGDDADIAFTDFGGELEIDNPEAASALLGSEMAINSIRLDYTTEGLDNKREIALTVPDIDSWNENDEVHFGDAGQGRAVAWVRFGETTDSDGNRVLVIDEIQSKRHQEGREQGYITDEDKTARRLHDEYVKAREMVNDYETVLERKYNVSHISDEMLTEEEAEHRRGLWKAVQDARDADRAYNYAHPGNRLAGGIPDAPFEKNWHELAMKRMLRYAAENGFDKVAWTMGEQQAERYNIGGKIERIVKTDDHVYEVYLNNKPMMDLEFDEDGIYRDEGDPALDGKSISDVFGKSLAERLDALPVGERLQEDGLRMGGEGMKGFYDEILPRFMDKYGKKWGIKTVDVTLPYVEESGRTMHSVDLTPEMRESVMEGQPMFLRTDSGEVYGFTKDGKIYIDPRKATAETPVHEFTHLWADSLRKANPKAWEQLKSELEKEKDLFDYVKSLYPELSGDDLMDEVFAHFSGRRGAERLRSEQEKMMQKAKGVFDKAKITTMFDRLRNILHDFWTQARDLFAGKTEGIERLSAEDFADMALADLIKGEKPLAEGKKETRYNKAAGENKSLMGVHNISAEKLSKAIKQGGLANPSLAVIDTDERMHNDYGEISLIPKAELLNAKGGRNAGTYLGDAWTPTYPGVTQFITKQGEKHIEALAKQLANGNRDVELFVKSRLRDYAEQNGSSLHLAYLLARGKNPELKGKETKYSHEEYEALEDIFGEGVKDVNSDLTEEQHAKLKNLIMSFIEKDIEERSKDIQDAETRNKAKEYLREIREKAWFDEEGRLKFAKWDSYVHNVKRSEQIRQNPEIDWVRTESEAHQRILKEGLTDDYNNWLQEVFDDGDIEEKLFAGFTPSGNRRYLPNTVENASKLMNRNSDTNAYDNGGFSATRSSLLQKVTTLAQIRKNKGKLKASDEIEEKTSEMSDRLFNIISQIADLQKISDNRFMNTDYAELRLQDAITKRDPIKYLNEEYGYDINNDSDLAKEINDFIKDTKELPVKYFETKFKRPVRLDEFAIAVVPENTSPDIVNSLKAAGLDVRTYDNSNQQTRDEERERVTKEAVRERDDILFRNDDVSEYSFRTLRSDRFYKGISNSDAFAELLDENTSWVDGSLNLLRALKKRFGGEVVSASSGAKYALEHGLVPVPDGKYSGKDGEYHHIEFESDNGERFVESVPFVDAESVGDDYGIRYSESDGVSARADMDRAHEVAEEWTEKLNLNDDVQIVDELTREMVDELMPNASEEVKEKALKAKGWFNEKTGKIVIAIGNHRNAEDVMQTILHEGVAHYGLRKLFGENFNTFLDNVYASADASVRKRIDVLQENKGYGRREAVEEYLAGLAEVTDFESVVSRTWWEKVKSLFADMLNSIGLSGFADNSLPLSDNELRYILWRSYDNLKSDNDVFRQAKDIAMQSELKVGNYYESKDATLGELVSGDRQLRERFGDEEGYNTGEEATDFHTVIDEIFDNADFDKSVHQRERYDLGKTPTWMKRIGIAGDRFSLSFKNIKTHKGKDADHDLTREEWHQLPDALKNPFAVTRYNDANDRFRLYVNVMHNGNYVAVGVDVKCVNQGRNLPMMEVNTIKTVFAHHGEIGGGEKLITYDKEITPKQEALLRGLNFREYPTIQELSAAKITNNSHMRSIESKKVDEKNYLYREQDESEDVYDAGRRSLEETLTQGLIDLSEKNRSDVGLRISAMKAINSNLSELRSAMSRQREYDKSTVNRIVRWARMLMESGIGGNLTRYEVKRLTGMIAQAAGKEDITRQAGQVMDLLINNQLRASKDLLQKQMRIKGSKIDARGVEVQGALDIRGQRMIGAFKEGISLGEDAFYGLPVCRNIKRLFGNFRFATIAKSIPNSRMTQQRYYKILRTYVLH